MRGCPLRIDELPKPAGALCKTLSRFGRAGLKLLAIDT